MSKSKQEITISSGEQINESLVFNHVSGIIENRKARAGAYANSEVTLMYWEIGRYINTVLLGNERATYGKRIVTALTTKLTERYGKTFEEQNLRRKKGAK
ncbi:MAG: DUF1016 N-terminal domain-containing protein [Firmicutes bacterium]|nr:DUF1016 N-terminal domain-containing protein [Bacillota bacterium]